MGATIVANTTSGGDCSGVGGAGFTDDGDNLDDDGTCNFTAGTDLSNTSAGLDSSGLENNGGATKTIALESGSAAIDQVSNGALCPATDQRGAPRTTPCDIGAYDTDWGPAVELNVTGSQTTGGNASFSYTTNAPGGTVSGTATCTTVDDGTPISSGLTAGYYAIDGSSCSGLTSSDQSTYAIFPSSYTGVLVVSAFPPWSVAPSPDQGSDDNSITGVSCISATDCVAVGDYAGSVEQTLIESWNGSAWSVVSSPDQGSNANGLEGVSCTSSTSCVAVGYYENGSNQDQTLILSWNGSAWTIVSSPDQGSGYNTLNGVSCVSPTDCVAAGFYVNESANQTLIESFDGSAWTIVSSPDPGIGALLAGISCTSATSCTAAGTYSNGSANQTLIESFDGSAWSVVSSPDAGSNDQLYAVSCTSSSFCVAVGFSSAGSGEQTLAETWDGSGWSIVSSPDPSGADNLLSGVSCTGPTDCVAAGYASGSHAYHTLVETLIGGGWSVSSSPNVGSGGNYLGPVSCTSDTSCLTAGDYTSGSTDQTLMEMASGPVVAALNPATGFTTGGASVTITGSGFTGATAVNFGANPATIDSESGGTSLTVSAPPSSAGTVDVTVTAPGGVSDINPADQYTYTVDQTSPSTQTCSDSTCPTNTVSTALNQTVVSVPSQPGPTGATTDLLVNTATLSCGAAKAHDYDYSTAVATLSTTGFTPTAALRVTESVANTPSAAGVKVCYGAGQDPARGTFLRPCNHAMTAPCLESLQEAGGSVTATIKARATDPRFWTGEAAVDLTSFSPTKGAPDATVTIKGKNLTGVLAVVIGGAEATISPQSTATKLVVAVPAKAVTGHITVTSAAGEAVSTKSFTVT